MVKVSVCVPVYNASEFLRPCLDSLINQTLKDIEIIAVNDGSTDNSADILSEYPNVIVVNQPNKGLGGARNAAIKIAKGEYIGFVDADDFVDETMFEKLYNLAIESYAEIAFCNLDFYPKNVKTNKKKWFTPFEGIIDAHFLNRNTQPWNKIVSRKLMEDVNFNFFSRNGDGAFIQLFLLASSRGGGAPLGPGVVSTNEVLYHYRIGHASLSTVPNVSHMISSLYSAKKQKALSSKSPYAIKLSEYFDYKIIIALNQLLVVAITNENKDVYRRYVKELKTYKKNVYIDSILKYEYSGLKFLGFKYILPNSYYLSKILLKGMKFK